MPAIGKVSLKGLPVEDFINTFLVKIGGSEATQADAGNAAMSIDTTTANQVKLAVDGERIYGRLEVREDRVQEGIVVGSIARKGGVTFNVSPTVSLSSPITNPAIGDFLVGAVNGSAKGGFVRKASTAEIQAGKSNWQVVELITNADTTKSVVAIDV